MGKISKKGQEYSSVEKIGGWKEANICYLHLIAGLILFIVDLLMLLGVI